ncbi:MAG: hypothetical protein FJ121_06775 [Deltaproteobacteria bacterium]|nr:hypothetical protein [Deltaproteobacteria bacterium]
MPDKTEIKDLETVLARLKQEWQELAELLTSQGKSQDRVIEVEKILLRDASGQFRGKISANQDGSADLLLSDRAGRAWVRLGVNQDGEAFLELKDQRGESSFKVAVGAPFPGAFAGPAATPADAPDPGAPEPVIPAAAGGESRGESGSVPPAPTPDPDLHPEGDANFGVSARLEKLARQHRRQKFYWALILGVLGVILATQAYVIFRPHPSGLAGEALVVRDPNGRIRASLGATDGKVSLDLWDPQGLRRASLGLGSDGTPGLAFYDQDQRVRAELHLGADGEPQFTLRDKRTLQGKTEPNAFSDSSHRLNRQGTVLGAEDGAVASPPAGQTGAVSPNRDAEAEVELVGSKTSNKYHYPTCKWVRAITPWRLIKFKSAAEAQVRQYVPCPVCKPPPLSRQSSSAP